MVLPTLNHISQVNCMSLGARKWYFMKFPMRNSSKIAGATIAQWHTPVYIQVCRYISKYHCKHGYPYCRVVQREGKVKLLPKIKGLWWANYIRWVLPGTGHLTCTSAITASKSALNLLWSILSSVLSNPLPVAVDDTLIACWIYAP